MSAYNTLLVQLSDTTNITRTKEKTVQQQSINMLIVLNLNMEHPFDRCSQKLLVPPDLKKKPSDFQTEGSLEPSVLNPIGNTAPGS